MSAMDREERRAAMLARRSTWAPTECVLIPASEVRVGDFVERVPTQAGVTGAIIMSGVRAVEHEWDAWGQRGAPRRPMFPVESVRWSFHESALVDVSVPATFTVVVRREVTP
jgi:hypothetical protein